MSNEKIFFNPGDTVKVNKIDGPVMVVKRAKKVIISGSSESRLEGICCYWFTTDHLYQEQVFDTKDLVKC